MSTFQARSWTRSDLQTIGSRCRKWRLYKIGVHFSGPKLTPRRLANYRFKVSKVTIIHDRCPLFMPGPCKTHDRCLLSKRKLLIIHDRCPFSAPKVAIIHDRCLHSTPKMTIIHDRCPHSTHKMGLARPEGRAQNFRFWLACQNLLPDEPILSQKWPKPALVEQRLFCCLPNPPQGVESDDYTR